MASPRRATADADYEAQRNGFTDGTGSVSVAVNIPPTQGPNVGTPNAVEVVITKTQSLSFASLLNPSSSGYALTARAVAIPVPTTTTTSITTTTTSTASVGCLVALTPNNEQGVLYMSATSFTADCMIMSNGKANATGAATSNSTGASIYMYNNGTGLTNTSSATFTKSGGIWTSGSFTANTLGSLTVPAGQTLVGQTTSIIDPYASLATPSPGTCTYTNFQEPVRQHHYSQSGHVLRRPVGHQQKQRLLHAGNLLHRQRRYGHFERHQRFMPELHAAPRVQPSS